MKKDIFVFAGQSNMMGAAVFPPIAPVSVKSSFEYKHKRRRLGESKGEFLPVGYPVGEFSYADLKEAYCEGKVNERGESYLADYLKSTFFCPAMSNLLSEEKKEQYSFSHFSEATASLGATLAPFMAEEWERLGGSCAYAHIAKGGVSINYYLTDEMSEEYTRLITAYNEKNATNYDPRIPNGTRMTGAADYFLEKCKDLFEDAQSTFGDTLSENRCFFWLQGESDAAKSATEYEIKTDILWKKLKEIGFTHFFCIRVDYFGAPSIHRVMKAQESFVAHNRDAYMLTRAASFFTYVGQNEEDWFISPPDEEYRNCRDSFYGFANQHINEKGFSVIAKHSARNLYRVLVEGKEPLLEEEIIKPLLSDKS